MACFTSYWLQRSLIMNHLYALIDTLIAHGIQNELISKRDEIYVRNRLLAAFNTSEYEASSEVLDFDLYETLDALAAFAVKEGLIEDSIAEKDIFTSNLMNIFLPAPSMVENKFWTLYEKSPIKATNYFYHLSQNVNYIKMSRIAKNVQFKANSPYGDIDITINLSKPEKDPKEIARLKTAPPNKYPSCLLCIENEGYNGTLSLPDRANHRTIAVELNHRLWRLQYSPYLYYNEHCIFLSEKHEPMHISKDSFYTLLSFTKMFPHYFIGSNADLPIVGGSILSHEHYQGGCYEFPIHRAGTLWDFTISKYPNVKCSVLNWPMSTIELTADSLEDVAECTNYIFETWKNYSDAAVDIIAYTDDTPHNTVTPVAKRKDGKYSMLVVLRNNRTTTEHPLGIFHPHADVQHVKKENIGLIEVMGLAILPGRLLQELEDIKTYIIGKRTDVAPYHMTWANDLKENYDGSDLTAYVQAALGKKFTRVLEDAGVFKLTDEGIAHFKAFTENL